MMVPTPRHRTATNLPTSQLLTEIDEEAAAELGVSVALIEEWRGRLGVMDRRPRT